MLRVALTGNIASGKSSVARVWRSLGALVVDADELARDAVAPGTPGLEAVVARWGREVLGDDGALDRSRLREIVFSNPADRTALEEIVHPEVARLREAAHREAERVGAPIVVSDIPLLYEVGLQDEFDVVVLVDAPASLRVERMVRERGLAVEQAERMVDAQMPAERKRELADVVIDNSGSRGELELRASQVWRSLRKRVR